MAQMGEVTQVDGTPVACAGPASRGQAHSSPDGNIVPRDVWTPPQGPASTLLQLRVEAP